MIRKYTTKSTNTPSSWGALPTIRASIYLRWYTQLVCMILYCTWSSDLQCWKKYLQWYWCQLQKTHYAQQMPYMAEEQVLPMLYQSANKSSPPLYEEVFLHWTGITVYVAQFNVEQYSWRSGCIWLASIWSWWEQPRKSRGSYTPFPSCRVQRLKTSGNKSQVMWSCRLSDYTYH